MQRLLKLTPQALPKYIYLSPPLIFPTTCNRIRTKNRPVWITPGAAPIRWMGPIRNPRWEQKRTEGYVIVSIQSQEILNRPVFVLEILNRVLTLLKILNRSEESLNRVWTLLTILKKLWTESEHYWQFWKSSEHSLNILKILNRVWTLLKILKKSEQSENSEQILNRVWTL
jgi:hypothetical protein